MSHTLRQPTNEAEEGGKYDHLPLARLLLQYQQQQQQQEISKQEFQKTQLLPDYYSDEEQQWRRSEQKQKEQQVPAELDEQVQPQQQEKQEFQSLLSYTTTIDTSSSSFTPTTSSSLQTPPPLQLLTKNEAGFISDAATLPAGRVERFLTSRGSKRTTSPAAVIATAAPREALAGISQIQVQLTEPFDDPSRVPTTSHAHNTTPPPLHTSWATTAIATRTPYGIAGTALPSLLFDPGEKPQLPPLQYQTQQSSSQQQHSAAWPAFTPPIMSTTPFSFHTTAFPTTTFERNKGMIENALHQMHQALDATIPLTQKIEYDMAINMAPHLVQLESNPITFLRYANWDARAAAYKLVAYWKRRVAIFGPDRAFLPLRLYMCTSSSSAADTTTGGESALCPDDVVLIQAGFIAYADHHPRFASESAVVRDRGNTTNTVVVFDASRRNRDAWDVQLRAFFYHAHCIAENPLSQTEGFVVLCIVQSPEFYDHQTMECLAMLLDTFPVRLKEWHTFDCSSMALLPSISLLSSSSSSSSALLRQGFVLAFFEIFLDVLNEYKTYHYSVGDFRASPSSSSSSAAAAAASGATIAKTFTPDEIRWELETEHGFTAEEIPSILGGCWTYDAFHAWLQERMYYERSRYLATSDHFCDVGSLLRDNNQNQDNKRAGLSMGQKMDGVANDTYHHDRRRCFGMGRSAKRSKRDQYLPGWMVEDESDPPEWMGREESEGRKEEEREDAKPRAVDRKQSMHQQRRQMEGTQENGSLDNLMKKFQQLFFHDSSTSAALPKQHHPQQDVDINLNLTFSTFAVSPFMSSRLNRLHPIALLEKALDAIPMHDKAELMMALQVAPRLVARESDPMRFLLYHAYDAQRAAQGLANYWKTRHEWFGDRAYRPMAMMSLTDGSEDAGGNGNNNGPLDAEDIGLIRSGYSVIVGTDRQGSPVLIWDSSRLKTDSVKARLRAGFYLYQVLTEYHASQTQGIVLIAIVRTINLNKTTMKVAGMLAKTFPVKFKAIHSFDCLEKKNVFVRGFIQGLVGVYVRFFNHSNLHFYTLHCQQERERNVQILEEEHGLTRELLPCSIGGTWKYEKFDEWLIQRIQEEKQLHLIDKHMNDESRAVTLNSREALPLSAPNPATWNQHLGAATQSVTVAQDPKVDNVSASSISTDVRKTNTEAIGRDLDEILREQESGSYKDADQDTSPACTFAQVHTNENSALQDDKYLLTLDNEIRRFPVGLTAAYLEAIQKAPREIWNDECSAELFLRVEDFDAKKAAERLVRYWQLRSQIYGTRRYHRLTQTSDEALGRRDLPVLNTGFLTLLPMDSQGRSVLCIDPGALKATMWKEARDRCIVYMMSLLTENDKSQTDGAILIHKVYPPEFSFVHLSLFEQLITALPLRVHAIHLVCDSEVPPAILKSLEPLNAKVHVHTSDTKEGLLFKLEKFGLTKSNLPKFVNGDWGYEKFFQWQELRMRMEWKIPAGWNACTDLSTFPGIKFCTHDELDAPERKRRMNLIHYRRKQNRDRLAIAILKEHCVDLQEKQKELRLENKELESKHSAAFSLLRRIPHG